MPTLVKLYLDSGGLRSKLGRGNKVEKKLRSSLLDFLTHIHPPRINRRIIGFWPTMCMGGLSFFLFIVLSVTGLLLMLFYQPGDSQLALTSITVIQDVIPYGGFIRSLHKWAGQLMVFTVMLHLIRVVLTNAYRPPKELNWVIGVILLIFTVALDFSGYLLVGDVVAREAGKIASALMGEVPGIGGYLQQIVFAGNNPLTALGGLRVYIWHCLFLPMLSFLLMGWHFFRVRKDGGVEWPL